MNNSADSQIEKLLDEVSQTLYKHSVVLPAMGGGTELPFSYEISKLMDMAFCNSISCA